MKNNKLADLLFISVFLIFILIVATVTIIKPKAQVSYYENRTLAGQPGFETRAVLDIDYFQKWEKFFTDHAAGRATLVRIGTLTDLSIIKRPVVNNVVTSDGILLGFNAYETVSAELIRAQSRAIVDELSAFDSVVSSYGGVFYFVTVPEHYSWYFDKYPWYLNNRSEYTQASLEVFMSDISGTGIKHIGMGEILAGLSEPPAVFSATDHHYTFRSAYETYRAIVNRINDDNVFYLPLYGEFDLTFLILENPFLGSRMRRLLGIPGLTERIEIAFPNEEVQFTRSDNGKLRETPGVYSLPYNVWDVVDYTVYMGGDIPETVIDTGRDLPSILIYGDSSTNAVECLMYLSGGVFRSIDLRHYKDMSLSEYVEMYKPDIVIGIRGYEVLLEKTGNGVLMS